MENQLNGQISLNKTDIAMNKLYTKVKNFQESDEMADKLQGYLNHECQLPLPSYQDGGVFTNYIKSDQFKTECIRLTSNLNCVDNAKETLKNLSEVRIKEAEYDKNEDEQKVRASTQMAIKKGLGKVHLTKQMQRDREIFLGVKQKNKAARQNNSLTGNESLAQAWNTTGFLPTTIPTSGQKNSVKDFEYLKFLNDSILKDDVLDKFMQKAGEIEMAAGPRSISPKKQKPSHMTPMERIQDEIRKNPHRMHTNTRFESFFTKDYSSASQTNKATKRAKMAAKNAAQQSVTEKTQIETETSKERKPGHFSPDKKYRIRDRHSSAEQQVQRQDTENENDKKFVSRQSASPIKRENHMKLRGAKQLTSLTQQESITASVSSTTKQRVFVKLNRSIDVIHERSNKQQPQQTTNASGAAEAAYDKQSLALKPSTAGTSTRKRKQSAVAAIKQSEENGGQKLEKQPKVKLVNRLDRASADFQNRRGINSDLHGVQQNSKSVNVTQPVNHSKKTSQNFEQYLIESSMNKNKIGLNNQDSMVNEPYKQSNSISRGFRNNAVMSPKSSSEHPTRKSSRNIKHRGIVTKSTQKDLDVQVDDLAKQFGKKYREKSFSNNVHNQQLFDRKSLDFDQNYYNIAAKIQPLPQKPQKQNSIRLDPIQHKERATVDLLSKHQTIQQQDNKIDLQKVAKSAVSASVKHNSIYKTSAILQSSIMPSIVNHGSTDDEKIYQNNYDGIEDVDSSPISVIYRSFNDGGKIKKGYTKFAAENNNLDERPYNTTSLEPILVSKGEVNQRSELNSSIVTKSFDKKRRSGDMGVTGVGIQYDNSKYRQTTTSNGWYSQQSRLMKQQHERQLARKTSKHNKSQDSLPSIITQNSVDEDVMDNFGAKARTSIATPAVGTRKAKAVAIDEDDDHVNVFDIKKDSYVIDQSNENLLNNQARISQDKMKRVYNRKMVIVANRDSVQGAVVKRGEESRKSLESYNQADSTNTLNRVSQSKLLAHHVFASDKRKMDHILRLQPIRQSMTSITILDQPNAKKNKSIDVDHVEFDKNQQELQLSQDVVTVPKAKRTKSKIILAEGVRKEEYYDQSEKQTKGKDIQTPISTTKINQFEKYNSKTTAIDAQTAKQEEENKIIQKDEAIEMIQTGQQEQFSNVLRQYLGSQQQRSSTVTATATQQKQLKTEQKSYKVHYERGSQQNTSMDINIIAKGSDLTRAQQHILSKSIQSSKNPAIYQQSQIKNNSHIKTSASLSYASGLRTYSLANQKAAATQSTLSKSGIRQTTTLQITKPVRHQQNNTQKRRNIDEASQSSLTKIERQDSISVQQKKPKKNSYSDQITIQPMKQSAKLYQGQVVQQQPQSTNDKSTIPLLNKNNVALNEENQRRLTQIQEAYEARKSQQSRCNSSQNSATEIKLKESFDSKQMINNSSGRQQNNSSNLTQRNSSNRYIVIRNRQNYQTRISSGSSVIQQSSQKLKLRPEQNLPEDRMESQKTPQQPVVATVQTSREEEVQDNLPKIEEIRSRFNTKSISKENDQQENSSSDTKLMVIQQNPVEAPSRPVKEIKTTDKVQELQESIQNVRGQPAEDLPKQETTSIMDNNNLAAIQIRPALKRPAFLGKQVIDIERENALIAALGSSVKIPILPIDNRLKAAGIRKQDSSDNTFTMMPSQTLGEKPVADMTTSLEERLLGSSIMAMHLDDNLVSSEAPATQVLFKQMMTSTEFGGHKGGSN